MIVQQSPHVVSRRIGSSWVLLEKNRKYLRQLNQTAGDIWQRTKKPVIIDRLISQIAAKYGIPVSQAEHDVRDFVTQYIRDGLLIRVNS